MPKRLQPTSLYIYLFTPKRLPLQRPDNRLHYIFIYSRPSGCYTTAMTDVMVGLVVEPLFIAQIWNIIQGETTASACSIQIASKLSSFLFCLSSIVHLSLISVDRYIAIMRPYIYLQTVTKPRVLIATALAWTLTLIINTLLLIDVEMVRAIFTAVVFSLISVVVFCKSYGGGRGIFEPQEFFFLIKFLV